MPEIIEELTQMLGAVNRAKYVLRLYVTGTTPQSSRAVANISAICERHLKGRYDLEVVDLFQRRELAKQNQIVVAPTLVKELPLPLRRLIGDLADTRQVLLALGVEPAAAEATPDAGKSTGKPSRKFKGRDDRNAEALVRPAEEDE